MKLCFRFAVGRGCPAISDRMSANICRDAAMSEGHIAAVGHNLRADLDQPLAQAGQRPWLRRLRHRQRSHEVANGVGQDVELEADGVGGEGAASLSSSTTRTLTAQRGRRIVNSV